MRQGFECKKSKPIFTFPETQWVVFYWQCDRNGVLGESQIRIGFQRNIRPQLLKSFQTQPNHEVEIKGNQNPKGENLNSDQIPAKFKRISLHLWLPRYFLHTSKPQLNLPWFTVVCVFFSNPIVSEILRNARLQSAISSCYF